MPLAVHHENAPPQCRIVSPWQQRKFQAHLPESHGPMPDLIKETLELTSTEIRVGAEREQGGMLFYYGYCRALDAGYNFRMYKQSLWDAGLNPYLLYSSSIFFHFSAVNSLCIEEESGSHLG